MEIMGEINKTEKTLYFVYVIVNPNGLYETKIGISTHMYNRLNNLYRTSNSGKPIPAFIFQVDSAKDMETLESSSHNSLSNYRFLGREYFSVHPDKACENIIEIANALKIKINLVFKLKDEDYKKILKQSTGEIQGEERASYYNKTLLPIIESYDFKNYSSEVADSKYLYDRERKRSYSKNNTSSNSTKTITTSPISSPKKKGFRFCDVRIDDSNNCLGKGSIVYWKYDNTVDNEHVKIRCIIIDEMRNIIVPQEGSYKGQEFLLSTASSLFSPPKRKERHSTNTWQGGRDIFFIDQNGNYINVLKAIK